MEKLIFNAEEISQLESLEILGGNGYIPHVVSQPSCTQSSCTQVGCTQNGCIQKNCGCEQYKNGCTETQNCPIMYSSTQCENCR